MPALCCKSALYWWDRYLYVVQMVSALKRVDTESRSWVVAQCFSRNRSRGQTSKVEVFERLVNRHRSFARLRLISDLELKRRWPLLCFFGAGPFLRIKEPLNPSPEWNLLVSLMHRISYTPRAFLEGPKIGRGEGRDENRPVGAEKGQVVTF